MKSKILTDRIPSVAMSDILQGDEFITRMGCEEYTY